LRLPPDVAVGTTLITEVLGFASGPYAYARQRLVDYQLGMFFIVVAALRLGDVIL
jgi:uncharacterized membrane protein YfcA